MKTYLYTTNVSCQFVRMRSRAQSTLEYAMTIGVTVMVLLSMMAYMNRSLQGNIKKSIDTVGEEHLTGPVPIPESGYRLGYVMQQNPTAVSWRSASSVSKRQSTSFTYEGEYGFAVTISGSNRREVGSLKHTVDPSMLPDQAGISSSDTPALSAMDKVAGTVADSSFNPLTQEASVLPEGKEGLTPDEGAMGTGNDGELKNIDSQASDVYNTYGRDKKAEAKASADAAANRQE